jgi:hypothetical protein
MDFGLTAVLGSKTAARGNWEEVSIMPHAAEFLDINIALRMFAGRNDAWFYEEDARLHALWDSLGVKHDYVELNEQHGGVSESTMSDILGYLDTAFAYGNSSSAKRDTAPGRRPDRLIQGRTAVLTSPHPALAGVAVYTYTGRRLPGHNRYSLPNGVYVCNKAPTDFLRHSAAGHH